MSALTQRPEAQILRSTQGKRIYILEEPIGEPTASGSYTTGLRVRNPSDRLTLTLELFYARIRCSNAGQLATLAAGDSGQGADTRDAVIGSVTNQAQLEAATPLSSIGAQTSGVLNYFQGCGILHRVLALTNMPFSYVLTSGVRELLALITITAPSVSAANVFPLWMARAHFEASIDVPDDELLKLFEACGLKVLAEPRYNW